MQILPEETKQEATQYKESELKLLLKARPYLWNFNITIQENQVTLANNSNGVISKKK